MFNIIELDLHFTLKECEDIIQDNKDNINKESRFYKFYNDVKCIVENSDKEHSEKIMNSKEFLEGYRDYFEFRQIFKSSNIQRNAYKELLYIFKGNRLSSYDRDHKARNYQYQLYLGAFFEMRGLTVRHEEPDLVIDLCNRSIAVAIKRVNSIERIGERIREGEKQIIKSGYEGMIAVSLDYVINQEEMFIAGKDSKDLFEIAMDKIIDFLKLNHSQQWFCRDKKIIAVLFTLTVPHKISGMRIFGSTFPTIIIPVIEEGDCRMEIIDKLNSEVFNRKDV